MLSTGRTWVRTSGHALNSMTDLKPHTPEWFNALDRVNPQQAAMTRQAIAAAGRDDGCSVCGDDRATDDKLVVKI